MERASLLELLTEAQKQALNIIESEQDKTSYEIISIFNLKPNINYRKYKSHKQLKYKADPCSKHDSILTTCPDCYYNYWKARDNT